MSYCRFGDKSDVYMYDSVGGFVACCACRLCKELPTPWRDRALAHAYHWLLAIPELLTVAARILTLGFWRPSLPFRWHLARLQVYRREPDPEFYTYQEALDHLLAHRAAGHEVPRHAFEGLQEDIESGRKPADPYPPCTHGVASGEPCVECQAEWVAWTRDHDKNPFQSGRA